MSAKINFEEADYSIAAVSKLTGVSCHALRVWERCYGFPVPMRSPSGHRRYTRDQVRTLCRLSELSRLGQPIGELIRDMRAGRMETAPASAPGVGDETDESSVSELVDFLIAGDLGGGISCLERQEERLSQEQLTARIIGPALVDIGERWYRRECESFQEHFATAFLRRKLETLIGCDRSPDEPSARVALIGSVQGDRHQGGVLIFDHFLRRAGWKAMNLGTDLPVREYRKAVEAWRPDALGLSFALSRNINKRFRELSEIRGVPVFVGGRSIINHQGLARRYGLIPLPGTIASAGRQFMIEYDMWIERHHPRSAAE